MPKIPGIRGKLEGTLVEGTYRIAMDFRKRQGKRIVDLILHPKTTDLAKQNLEETVRVYNETNGFKESAA